MPRNQVPDRSNQSDWLEDQISLGDTGIGLNGVDILVVVDNDPTMSAPRMRMSTALYSLVTELLHPIDQSLLSSIRIASISSDMGLQYGRLFNDPETDSIEDTEVPASTAFGCDDYGDNGTFLPLVGQFSDIVLEENQISCEDYGEQCPEGWQCQMGYCTAPETGTGIACPYSGSGSYLENTPGSADENLALKAACMIHGPTSECVVRQPLEAAVKALSLNPEFISQNHLLMVLILSGRDDCSIADPALFEDVNWETYGPRIACFSNGNDDDYLYDEASYYDKFLSFKDNNPAAVLFAAVVGAPDAICSGTGLNIASNACLLVEEMENNWIPYPNEDQIEYWEVAPACRLTYGDSQDASPKPGRRLVKLATEFGSNGYIQSMCSSQWNQMVSHLSKRTLSLLSKGECRIDSPLIVQSAEDSCPECVVSRCQLYSKFVRTGDDAEDTTCPDELVHGEKYRSLAGYVSKGEKTVVFCPVESIPAPIGCHEAEVVVDTDKVGWYYCEKQLHTENNELACSDSLDNDSDGVIDCEQRTCEDCFVCGNSDGCELGCDYDVVLTPQTEELIGGQPLFLQCPSNVFDDV